MNYEYQVCKVQALKVIEVNGKFQTMGHVGVDLSIDSALDACPPVWKYLNQAGQEGWELVTSGAMSTSDGLYQILYLRRPLSSI